VADSWNGSWGLSWSNSWGASAAPVPTPESEAEVTTGVRGGFGGRDVRREQYGRDGLTARVDFEKRTEIAAEVRALYAELYRARPDAETADEAAALVSAYAPVSAPDLPAPEQIDWQALAEEQAKVAELVSMVDALRTMIERIRVERQEDEDLSILLLSM